MGRKLHRKVSAFQIPIQSVNLLPDSAGFNFLDRCAKIRAKSLLDLFFSPFLAGLYRDDECSGSEQMATSNNQSIRRCAVLSS